MFEADKKTVEPMTVAYLTIRGAYSQMTAAFDTLYLNLGTRGYTQVGPSMVAYLVGSEQGEENALWEVWAPIQDIGVEIKPSEAQAGVKRIPETVVASTTHTGPFSTLGPVYDALLEWVTENGHTIVGPAQEVYVTDPEQVKPEDLVTEIRIPIAAE